MEADTKTMEPGTAATDHMREGSTPAQNGSSSGLETVLKTGAYMAREEHLMKQEREGEISFVYVENDGTPQNMIYLIALKNIFSKQLPNMPKEYICRLVLERRHRSVALVKRNGTVVGGITYRTFPAQGFGEIAFCAVTSSEQVKGFGTRLMNHTKEFALTRDGLTHLLTYADNNAVGYFLKQGFTKEITLERERWHGYIKDYDGGTLMECVMHPKIHPAHLPAMLRTQRLEVESRIRSISNSHVVHKGLAQFQEPPELRKPVPIGDIPGVRQAGWSEEQYGAAQYRYRLVFKGEGMLEPTPENLRRFMQRLLHEVERAEDSWPFRKPVTLEEAPDYYDVVKDPVDITLIARRLESGAYYLTLETFVADLRRMFANCKTYNPPQLIYHKVAVKLDAFLDTYLTSHVIPE